MVSELSPSAKLEAVTAAIVKAVPDLLERSFEVQAIESGRTISVADENIRLEDVLQTVSESDHNLRDDCEPPEANMAPWSLCDRIVDLWVFDKPLADQSPETVSFLFDLLCRDSR